MLREVILRDNHTVQNVDSIVAELIVMTETKIQYATDEGVERDLVTLSDVRIAQKSNTKFYPVSCNRAGMC